MLPAIRRTRTSRDLLACVLPPPVVGEVPDYCFGRACTTPVLRAPVGADTRRHVTRGLATGSDAVGFAPRARATSLRRLYRLDPRPHTGGVSVGLAAIARAPVLRDTGLQVGHSIPADFYAVSFARGVHRHGRGEC